MKSNYLTWSCVLGTGTLAGVLLGTLLTGPSLRSEPTGSATRHDLGDTTRPSPAVPGAPPFEFTPEFPHELSDEVLVADLRTAIDAGDEGEAEDAGTSDPGPDDIFEEPSIEKPAPQVLPPAPHDATPITAAREKFVRDLIAERMPHASPEEREVWYEELNGLDPDVLVEVLNIRSALGAIVPLPPIQFDILPEHSPIPELADAPDGPESPRAIDEPFDELPLALPTDLPPSPTVPVPSTPRVVIAPENAIVLVNTLVALRRAERVLLDNIANAGTTGFRRRCVSFGTLPTAEIAGAASDPTAEGGGRANRVYLGNGARLLATPFDVSRGPLIETGRELDIAIAGTGWLPVSTGETIVYTRDGRLSIDAEGRVMTGPTGLPVEPTIVVPSDCTAIHVSPKGIVTVRRDGTNELTRVGSLSLARFGNSEGLTPLADNLFAESPTSGKPSLDSPGENGRGTISQCFLESSNVQLERERYELARLHAHIAAITALLDPTPSGGIPQHAPELVRETWSVELGRAVPQSRPMRSSTPAVEILDDEPEILVKESDQIALDERIDRARRASAENRFDEAADIYESLLAEDPRNGAALHGLGILAGRRGAHAEAEQRFLDAARIDPKNASLQNDLGFAYLMQRQFEKAEERFERALELEPNHRLAIANLAGLHARLGRDERALELFRRIAPESEAREQIAILKEAFPDDAPVPESPPERPASNEEPGPRLVRQPGDTTVE